jgi:hypothetical protein
MNLADDSTGMEIRIRVDRKDPLSGSAAADGTAHRLGFDGWMGLIGVIAELLGSDEDVREAG